MKLKNQYKDKRGLKIPDERMYKHMKRLDLTEQGIIDLMGDRILKPGFMSSFLETIGAQIRWYDRPHQVSAKLDKVDLEGFTEYKGERGND